MTKKRKPAGATKSATPKTSRQAFSLAARADASIKDRVAALAEVPLAVCEHDENFQTTLNLLRNPAEPMEVRLAALQTLQTASFSVVAFASCRGEYIAALRQVAQDPDPELRQRVLGILAREKDGFAQRKLLEGLQNPDKALVPMEKALQLLSYDVHADAYRIARDIVVKPPNETAKREALRLLAADASAAPMFEKILRDKDETAEIRQISAAALQAVRPDKLQEHAREMLLDTSEHDDLRATSLAALTEFGNTEALAGDKTLMARVDDLSANASAAVKRTANRFLSKYGRRESK